MEEKEQEQEANVRKFAVMQILLIWKQNRFIYFKRNRKGLYYFIVHCSFLVQFSFTIMKLDNVDSKTISVKSEKSMWCEGGKFQTQ